MKRIQVEISSHPQQYDILIGYDYLDAISEKIASIHSDEKLFMITDTSVNQFWGDILIQTFQKFGIEISTICFSAGEAHKTRTTKEQIENQLFSMKAGRDSVILALGGGVVGDMAGFVASTYMRGLPYYQIPTTTLAQADSSFGGKTGIDSEYGKNLIGTFYQPQEVFIDTKFLMTLDDFNFINGFVEIIKHGVIYDKDFYQSLYQNTGQIVSRPSSMYQSFLTEILLQNCKVKKEVVTKDPTEKGLRKILNFGHTLGHALETLSHYTISHGEAVALGMVFEAFLGKKIGKSHEEVFGSLCDIFKRIQILSTIAQNISEEDLYQTMLLDKKARKGNVEFVLLERIGKVIDEITVPISKDEFIVIMKEFRGLIFG